MSLSHFPHQEERGQPPQGCEASDSRFLAIMQESANVFWFVTPKGLMQEVSSSWQTFTGQRKSHSLGRGWLDALPHDDQLRMEETLLQLLTSGRSVEMNCRLRRSDGVYRLVHLRAIPVHKARGALHEVIVCGSDITEQSLNGQMNEAQAQLAVKVSGMGIWDWDCLTNQLTWTNQEKALFGCSPDTPATHELFLEAIHPDDRERVNRIIARALTEPQEYRVDYRVTWPDGSVHWLSNRARSIADAHGRPVRLVGTTIDITDLKQAEEQITTILESITDAFSHVDSQWRYTYVNRGIEKMMGKKREEVLGQCLWDMVPEVLGTPFEHAYREALATQQTRHIEGFHPDFRRWLDIHIYPNPDGLSFYLHDITERKQAEEALRESEARFRGLMDSNIIGITVSDRAGCIREANEAFLALVGYTREDLAAGQIQWQGLTSPECQAQHDQDMKNLLTTGTFQTLEKEFVTKDGRSVLVQVGGTLFHRQDSEPWILCFVLDLTARKEIERQKDLFLGMTSHELKTPLAALRGMLQLIQRRMKRAIVTEHIPPEWQIFFKDLAKNLQDSIRQIDVQTRLINDLLDVSRIAANTLKLSPHPCDLGDIVCQTVEDLRVIAPERSLLLDLPEHTTVQVLADRDRISQVVTNYVTNALRYSSPGQPVHIGLTLQEDVARVWVRDEGPGLSKEAQKELWQRFHQIKGVPVLSGFGKGLGLGLYICQTLIAQHQGEVGVESTPGEGSTFWFTLPLVK